MSIRIQISNDPISVDAVWREIADDTCGAWNVFLGVTRNHHEGKGVSGLEYEHYPEMAEKVMLEVAEAVAAAHGIEHFIIIHRVGPVAIGEASLLVAASSHHRHQALEGTHAFINRLKEDVPIWKKESFSDGSQGWVEGDQITPRKND